MSIIRVKKDARYFSASNEPFNDVRLSWEARGLMGYLLSKPDGWKIMMSDLESQGPAGNHKLRRMLAELRQHGYMNRIRVTKEHNTFDWITDVYESPSQNPNPSKEVVKAVSSGGKSTSGSSTSGSSTRGKLPDIVSTESVNTETVSTEEINTERGSYKKGDLVDAYLQLGQSPGMKREARINDILSYLAQRLHINTETKRWKEFAKFIDGKQQDGQKVEVFIQWLLSQKNFDIQFWPPAKMQEMWPQAFVKSSPDDRSKYVGGQYADFIEH